MHQAGRIQDGHRVASLARPAAAFALVALAAACGARRSPPPPAGDEAPLVAVASSEATAPGGAAPPAAAALVDAAPSPVDAAPAAAAAVDAGGPPAGWIDLAVAIPDAVLDLRYATAHNFTGATLYPVARCWLRADPAARLVAAAAALRARGHRLVLWDCYRPASIPKVLWQRVPDPRYVARPREDADGRPIAGSAHSRGAAVDLSLADLDGRPREMPTDHDAFTTAARGDAARGAVRAHLAALRTAMIDAGFTPLATEWWHFDARGGAPAPLADLPLE